MSQDQGRAGVPVEYTVVDDAQCVPAPSAAQLHDAPDSSGRPCTTCHRSAGGVPGYTYSGTPRDSSADHNSSYSGASRYLPPGPSTQSLTSAPHKTSTLKPSKYLGHHAVSCLRTRNLPNTNLVLLRQHFLAVSGSFLHELHPRADAELVVYVGEMALYGARRDEKPRGDVLVGQPFADQAHNIALGGR